MLTGERKLTSRRKDGNPRGKEANQRRLNELHMLIDSLWKMCRCYTQLRAVILLILLVWFYSVPARRKRWYRSSCRGVGMASVFGVGLLRKCNLLGSCISRARLGITVNQMLIVTTLLGEHFNRSNGFGEHSTSIERCKDRQERLHEFVI